MERRETGMQIYGARGVLQAGRKLEISEDMRGEGIIG